jgi:hypothetical protein
VRASANGPAAGLDPESDLLLACGGMTLTPQGVDRVRHVVRATPAWDRLLALAQAHGTFPLLFRHLHTTCADLVPRAVLDELRSRFHALAWRNLILEKELVELLERLRVHGIAAVPFKGPVLAAVAYDHVALRPFSDFDILVREADALKAKDFLLAAGYRLEPALTDAEAAALLKVAQEHHFTLIRPGSPVPVELHWRVIQRCYALPLDEEGLWNRLESVTLAGVKVPSFAAEDLLLLLCAHGAKHAWSRLCLLADLDGLIRARPRLHWSAILEEAAALNSRRLLAVGLLLTQDLLGTPLPAEVVDWLRRDAQGLQMVREVSTAMRHHPEALPAAEMEDRGAFFIRARERLADRIAIVAARRAIPAGVDRTALPFAARLYIYLARILRARDRDRDVVQLPGAMAGLYYLIRPMRLLGKYTAKVGRRLLGTSR